MAGAAIGRAPSQVTAPVTASYGGVDGYPPALVTRFRAAEEARRTAATAAGAAGVIAAAGTTRPDVRAPDAVSSMRICRVPALSGGCRQALPPVCQEITCLPCSCCHTQDAPQIGVRALSTDVLLRHLPGVQARAPWEGHERGFGSRMLAAMGHVRGTGLGPRGGGIVEPVQACAHLCLCWAQDWKF